MFGVANSGVGSMNKKYQVFVSSTYTDLIDERQDTLRSILDLGHIAAGMEGFFATDQEQLTLKKKIIDECDYYILIIAGRYGSVDEEGISYTEREYDYAVERGITVLAFIHEDIAALPSEKFDTDTNNQQRLEAFKVKASQRRLVRFWKTREQLKSDVIISLSKATREAPGIGWVRTNTAASETILFQINDVRNEVDRLRLENRNLKDELKPDVKNIAALSDIYEIEYSFVNRGSQGRYKGKKHLSWAEILQIVGPSFFSPSQQLKIKISLDAYLNKTNDNLHHMMFRIQSGVAETIKIQMAAYKFMAVYSGKAVNGGQAEFLKLTDLGKRTLLELKTVKAISKEEG